MTGRSLARLAGGMCKVFGLALVFCACAGMAHADTPLPGVPEVDPGSMMGALAFLSGGLLMITDRIRRK